jgi:hypothetical protein
MAGTLLPNNRKAPTSVSTFFLALPPKLRCTPAMGIMKKVGEILSPNDPELVEKTLVRIEEQDHWNDVFSTKLIELLDSHDFLKTEIRASKTALGEASTLASNAEIGLKRAMQTAQAAEKSLDLAAKRFDEAKAELEDARLALTRAKQVLTKVMIPIVIMFALLSCVVLLSMAFLRDQPYGRVAAVSTCIFIGIYYVALIRKLGK